VEERKAKNHPSGMLPGVGHSVRNSESPGAVEALFSNGQNIALLSTLF